MDPPDDQELPNTGSDLLRVGVTDSAPPQDDIGMTTNLLLKSPQTWDPYVVRGFPVAPRV